MEKPGIFIQSTKAGRLAREVGLRPGDQILECNGASFKNIEFGNAVFHLKSSRQLDLIVKKGAGLELFPSESSGYDSSASSSVGDNNTDSSDRSESVSSSTEDVIDVKQDTSVNIVKPPDPPPFSPTPQNSNNNEGGKRVLEDKIETERRKLLSEQDRLRREAEALNEERKKFEEEKRLLRSTIGKSTTTLTASKSIGNLREINLETPTTGHTGILKSPSAASSASEGSSSSGSSGSLAAALQLEIKRRAQKAASVEMKTDKTDSMMANKKSPYITEKNEKHDMLIAEFKKAHKKMFSSSTEVSEEESDFSKQNKVENKLNDDDVSTHPNEKPANKPKAPPPPPIRSVYSSMYTPSSSSSESLSSKTSPTSKPDKASHPPSRPSGTPGIPTPDYDSTPDRSPPGHKKKFTKHPVPVGSKHIVPPTVENIHRAKSLSSLTNVGAEPKDSKSHKTKAPAPNPLRGADSMKDIRQPPAPVSTSPSHSFSSRHSQQLPSIPYSASSKASYAPSSSIYGTQVSKKNLSPANSTGPPSLASRISSFQPEFNKRHPEMEVTSLESFQVENQNAVHVKPPSIYFEPQANHSPLDSIPSYSDHPEPIFEFLPKPCDPSKIPPKKNGEDARIASKDYRAVNKGSLSGKTYHQAELIKTLEKSRIKKPEIKKSDTEKSARSFGLKKAPAPMPPILRK